MERTSLACLLLLYALPSFSSGIFEIGGSIVQGGHTVHCTYSLYKSMGDRAEALGSVMDGDLSEIRTHNAHLSGMDDDEFNQYMRNEILSVAFCHPLASELMEGLLPGRNYLEPVETFTSVSGSVNRKLTYGVWAYNYSYRSLRELVNRIQSDLPSRPLWERNKYRNTLQSAKQLLEQFEKIPREPSSLAEAGSVISQWRATQAAATNRDRRTATDPRNMSAPSDADSSDAETLPDEASDSTDTRHPNQDLGNENDHGGQFPSGALRPTIPVYVLNGDHFRVFEVDTMHLMFPVMLEDSRSCFDRYTEGYPVAAQMVHGGFADLILESRLKGNEAKQLRNFYQSAAETKEESGFLVSDMEGLTLTGKRKTVLSKCLALVDKDLPEKPDPRNDAGGTKKKNQLGFLLSGSPVHFQRDDEHWQTLISVLAAKKIKLLADSH